jgi:hypothetical protein
MTGTPVWPGELYNYLSGMYKAVVEKNERPLASPGEIPDWLMNLIQNCWLRDPKTRSTIAEALAEIEDKLVQDGHSRQTPSRRERESGFFPNWNRRLAL